MINPTIILLIGQLLGRRRRRQRGMYFLALFFGLFACVVGGSLTVFGAPYSLIRSRQVAALPQPAPAQLQATPPGTAVLITAQLFPDAATDAYGLALSYVESRRNGRQDDDSDSSSGADQADNTSSIWQMEQPPPQTIEMQLTNGDLITIQLPAKPSFLNAQRFEEDNPDEAELRYVGYLPGQTLTIEGAWEGSNRLTAKTFYAGRPEDYLNFLTFTQPAGALMMGLCCSAIGIALVVGAAVLRIFGR